MANVKLVDVTKRFAGGQEAVAGLSLDIAEGEFVVLVGPSGSGKSTALRMIAGLEEITSGAVWIGDRLVNDLPPRDRDIAMVFQNYALYPHMTVADNMGFALRLAHMPKAEIDRRVRDAAVVLEHISPTSAKDAQPSQAGKTSTAPASRASTTSCNATTPSTDGPASSNWPANPADQPLASAAQPHRIGNPD
jgi:ABC-type sugar transport system ATPase subunit